MALRPLIVKLHFYHPGLVGERGTRGALAHLDYMGNPKKEELIRAGERDDRCEEAAVHAAYMAGRPGSTGYIGENPDRLPDPQHLAAELRQHKGPVWRAIVSVTEADVRTMGGDLLNRPAWEEAARAVLPRMADEMGIRRENLAWVAAMHRKKGHPHLHLLFWDRSAGRDRGVLSPGERRACLSLWVQHLYRPERDRLGREKSALREILLAGGRAEMGQVANRQPLGREGRLVPPRLTTTQAVELAAKLEALQSLPGHGRVSLSYMPTEVKAQARQVADWLISRVPEYRAAVERYTALAQEMAGHYDGRPDSLDKAAANAREDIRNRLAQQVLKTAVALDRAAKRDAVLDIAFAAARGRDWDGLPRTVKDLVHNEVMQMAGVRDPAGREKRSLDLARQVLRDPALAALLKDYNPSGAAEDRLADAMARCFAQAAEYVGFRQAAVARREAAAWWTGLMHNVREEEMRADRLATREEAERHRKLREEEMLR